MGLPGRTVVHSTTLPQSSDAIELQVLQQAPDLLAQKKTWTYGTWARDRYDDQCHWGSQQAVRWSAYGALAKFAAPWTESLGDRGAMLLGMRAEHRCCAIRGTMRTVNDRLGYWPVMRLQEAGLARATAPYIPSGRASVRFFREEAARLQLLLADCDY